MQTKPFVTNTEVIPDENLKPVTQAEEVLNWQTENSLVQNDLLQKIDKKIDTLADSLEKEMAGMSRRLQNHYKEIREKIRQLEEDVLEMRQERCLSQTLIDKERELRKARSQYDELKEFVRARQSPKPFEDTFDPYFVVPSKVFPTFTNPPKQPPFLPPHLQHIHYNSPRKSSNEKRKEKAPLSPERSPSPEPTSKKPQTEIASSNPTPENPQPSMMVPDSIMSAQENWEDKSEASSEDDQSIKTASEDTSEQEYADLSKILMTSSIREEREASTSYNSTLHPREVNTPVPSGSPLFSLDNIPPSQWRKKILRLQSMNGC